MVLGMPNVGKSSLINALRRHYLKKGMSLVIISILIIINLLILGKATTVGPLPGLTRTVSGYIKVISPDNIYFHDIFYSID